MLTVKITNVVVKVFIDRFPFTMSGTMGRKSEAMHLLQPNIPSQEFTASLLAFYAGAEAHAIDSEPRNLKTNILHARDAKRYKATNCGKEASLSGLLW